MRHSDIRTTMNTYVLIGGAVVDVVIWKSGNTHS